MLRSSSDLEEADPVPIVIARSLDFVVSPPPPVAVNDSFTVPGGATVDLDVLANDQHLTNHTISDLTQPAGGNTTRIINNSSGLAKVQFVAINPASTTVYTFQYRVDGSANLATVSVSVTHTATAVAVDDAFGPFAAGSTNDLDVLANDTKTSGVVSITSAVVPSVAVQPTVVAGKIRFVAPSPVATTNYTFQYTVDGSAPATVTTTVNAAGATTGIQLPALGYQQISDAVPAGSIWWNPTSGNDSNNGLSKGAAKKNFGGANGAEAAASPGVRIILAGTPGQVTYHGITSPIKPTKSGSNSGTRMELFAEPGCQVVLCRETDFLPILTRAVGWDVVDSGKKIYRCQLGSQGDGATQITASENSTGSNWLQAFIEIPNGPAGQPYVMLIPWIQSGNIGATSGVNAPNGYGGPVISLESTGKILLRLQPPIESHAGNEWPTDGIMGGLIGSNGVWREPSGIPSDYRIRVIRATTMLWGNTSTECFDFTNNVSWWRIRGVNVDLCVGAINLGSNTGISFERMTRYAIRHDIRQAGVAHTIVNDHCLAICPAAHHLSWQTYKASGIWAQYIRSAPFYSASAYTSPRSDYTWNDCMFYGWFDFCYLDDAGTPPIDFKFSHCAMLLTVDDGWCQGSLGGQAYLELDHCFVFGGPMISGGKNGPDSGTPEIHIHDCIWDNRIPLLWRSYGENIANPNDWTGIWGIAPNAFGCHFQDGWRAYKCYNNTFITCGFGGKEIGNGIAIAIRGDQGENIGAEWEHEVYNNIFMITGSRSYTHPKTVAAPFRGDWIVCRYSSAKSVAGTQRYDYNIYCRSVPWTPICPEFVNFQDSKGVNVSHYSNLANYKNNVFSSGSGGHYARSSSMYSDGTAGHEQHGAEQNPNFVDINGLDYRPRGSSSLTGAKNLTGTGWPGTSVYKPYKGAIDPNGNGSDCGPRP